MGDRVALIGGGSREHALAWIMARSDCVGEIWALPGNAGMAALPKMKCIPVFPEEIDRIVDFCVWLNIDYVVVGPEKPLVMGLADRLRNANIQVFGPRAAHARLEADKSYMKNLCEQLGIPTAKYQLVGRHHNDAISTINALFGFPVVLKRLGVGAQSKGGVIIAHNETSVRNWLDALPESETTVLVEEFLDGEEVSFFAAVCTNSTRGTPFMASSDYKRVFNHPRAAMTGSMGSVSPSPIVDRKLAGVIMDKIMQPVFDHFGYYSGVLYAGLMITADGPKLLEYNVRWGGGETESMVCTIDSDFYAWLRFPYDIGPYDSFRYAVSIQYAALGYPWDPLPDTQIDQLGDDDDHSMIFHTGTRYTTDTRIRPVSLIAPAGRALAPTAWGENVQDARSRAYDRLARIKWRHGFYRDDIGLQNT